MFKCNTCLYENQPYDGIKCCTCHNSSKYVSAEREENMENKNYIVINGKKAELTEEQLKQLGIEVEKPNPYERSVGRIYCSSTSSGSVFNSVDNGCADDKYYSSANYCTNEEMARQDMLHDLLNRKLRQFSNLNGGIELNSDISNDDWIDDELPKWYIIKRCVKGFQIYWHFDTEVVYMSKQQGVVYFINEEIAKRAIKEVIKPFMKEHKEFVW